MLKTIIENANAAAVAAQASVAFNKTPHLPGRGGMGVLIVATGLTTNPATVKIQTSDDPASVADGAATWTDAATVNLAVGDVSKLATIQSGKRVRTNVTAASAAGKFSAYAIAL